MNLDALLSTIILVSFLVTILMAIASYAAYKLREHRQPRTIVAPVDASESPFFERVLADPPPGGEEGA
jgi:hypothetical protein